MSISALLKWSFLAANPTNTLDKALISRDQGGKCAKLEHLAPNEKRAPVLSVQSVPSFKLMPSWALRAAAPSKMVGSHFPPIMVGQIKSRCSTWRKKDTDSGPRVYFFLHPSYLALLNPPRRPNSDSSIILNSCFELLSLPIPYNAQPSPSCLRYVGAKALPLALVG